MRTLCAILVSALSLVAQSKPTSQPASKPAQPAGIDLARWKTFGIEGKWVAYKRATANHAGSHKVWMAFLGDRREHELLEWIVIYEGWSNSVIGSNPGNILVQADAPQWIRAALWCLKARDGHAIQAARKALVDDAARVLGWIEKFPESKRLGAKSLLPSLDVEAEDPGKALPPLDPMSVLLPYLDAPKNLLRFGDRKTAKRSERFLHQVVRAIDGVTTAGQWEEPFRGKLMKLTRHPDAELRRHAILAFTRWPPQFVPSAEFLKRFEETTDDKERKHLLMAASYSDHPRSWLALHQVATDPTHPCWQVALSRLADLNSDFGIHLLQQLRVSGERGALSLRAINKIRARKSDPQHTLRVVLPALIWAQNSKHGLAKPLESWVRAYAAHPRQPVRQLVEELSGSYLPEGALKREQKNLRFAKQVRAFAKSLAAKWR